MKKPGPLPPRNVFHMPVPTVTRLNVAIGTIKADYWDDVRPATTNYDIISRYNAIQAALVDGSLDPVVSVRRLASGRQQVIAGLPVFTISRTLFETLPSTTIMGTMHVYDELPDHLSWRIFYDSFEDERFYCARDRAIIYRLAKNKLGSLEGVFDDVLSRGAKHKAADVLLARKILEHRVTDAGNLVQRDAQWLMGQIGRSIPTNADGKVRRNKVLLKIRRMHVTNCKEMMHELRRYVGRFDDIADE